MKSKQFNYFLLFFSIALFIGCTKNKPKEGHYTGVFTYTTPNNFGPLTEFYRIVNTNSNTIEIEMSDASWKAIGIPITLSKNKKQIVGNLPSVYENNGRKINGTLEKEKGKYKIVGTFTQSGGTPQGAYYAEGTFELKPN